MAVRRFAATLQAANALDKSGITKSSPGGSLTGSNIVQFDLEDTSAGGKAAAIRALEAIKAHLLNDTWPPA